MQGIASSPAPNWQPPSQPHPRRNITRGKTGCLTCRKRRKKCDERQPNCNNCERNRLICEGYQRATKWVPKSSRPRCNSARGVLGPIQDAVIDQSTREFTDSENNFNHALETQKSLTSVRLAGKQLNTESVLQSPAAGDNEWVLSRDGVAEPFPRQPMLRSLQNEINDRDLELETELLLPFENPSVVCDQNCHKEHPITSFGNANVALRYQNSISHIPRAMPALVDGIHTRLERRIFHHYVNVVSRALTLNTIEEKNPFTTLIIPLALTNRGLLRLILSCSASHLTRVQESNGINGCPEMQQIKEAKLTFYGDALKIHSRNMVPVVSPQQTGIDLSKENYKDTENTDLDAVLAMTMFMCQFDTCESGRDGIWRSHLNAAREIIRLRYSEKCLKNSSRNVSFDGSPENSIRTQTFDSRVSQFLIDWFFYHDVLASITDSEQQSFLDIFSNSIKSYGNPSHPTSLAGCSGCSRSAENVHIDRPDGFLSIIARIMNLRLWFRKQNPEGATPLHTFQPLDAEILDAGLSIAEELQNWSFSGYTFEQEIIGQCDRWASYILLYATIYPAKGRCSEIQSALEEGLFYLEQLFPTDNPQTCFLFPIFVFGVTAVEKVHCQAIKNTLDAYNNWSSLGNVNEVKEFLTEIWNRPQNPTDPWWAWEKEMKDQNRCLILV